TTPRKRPRGKGIPDGRVGKVPGGLQWKLFTYQPSTRARIGRAHESFPKQPSTCTWALPHLNFDEIPDWPGESP
ncbi:hypothetical protein FA13DRAFT_1729845, partial [Coprinellus micaceus]